MILIVDDQIEQQAISCGKGGDDPCGKAIGVHRDADGGGACVQLRQILRQLRLQQGHLVMVADQAQARWRCGAGLASVDQQAAHAFFEGFQALRDGRGGDAKRGRRQIKAATAVDCGKGGKKGIGKH